MIVSINQPAYLPWLGYFDRIAKSDIYILLDHVQFEKNSMANRNKVRTPPGWVWLTVPIRTKGRFGNLGINNLEINSELPWARKHWKTIHCNYARATYFEQYATFFQELYTDTWEQLDPLMSEITKYLLSEFEITTQLVKSSSLDPQYTKSDLVLELCRKVEANIYLSGPFGRQYLDRGAFERAGIELRFHDYPHPEYRQAFDGFEPYMSAIDLLFNHGSKSRDILISSPNTLKSE